MADESPLIKQREDSEQSGHEQGAAAFDSVKNRQSGWPAITGISQFRAIGVLFVLGGRKAFADRAEKSDERGSRGRQRRLGRQAGGHFRATFGRSPQEEVPGGGNRQHDESKKAGS